MTIAFDKAVWTVLREPGTFFAAYFTKEEAYAEVKALHEASPHLCFKIRKSGNKYIIVYREI